MALILSAEYTRQKPTGVAYEFESVKVLMSLDEGDNLDGVLLGIRAMVELGLSGNADGSNGTARAVVQQGSVQQVQQPAEQQGAFTPLSDKQRKYMYVLANKELHGTDAKLEQWCHEVFGCQPSELSLEQAKEAITTLKMEGFSFDLPVKGASLDAAFEPESEQAEPEPTVQANPALMAKKREVMAHFQRLLGVGNKDDTLVKDSIRAILNQETINSLQDANIVFNRLELFTNGTQWREWLAGQFNALPSASTQRQPAAGQARRPMIG